MKYRVIYIIVVLSLNCISVICQSPAQDPTWTLNTSLSDEFNAPNINLNKWLRLDGSWYGVPTPFHESFATIENYETMLRLKAGFYNGSFYGGGIESVNNDYRYGYYEIRALLPGYRNNGVPCSRGFWTAFWIYNQVIAGGCVSVHDEIDILEPSGSNPVPWAPEQESDAQTNSGGIAIENNPCDNGIKQVDHFIKHGFPVLFDNFHKFAVEWMPNYVTYYFDDVPYRTVFMDPNIGWPSHYCKVVIDNQLQPQDSFNLNTPFPLYYWVDYFRYHELNTGYCSTNGIYLNNNDLLNHENSVYNGIYFGDNGSGSISFSSGVVKFFRAQEILIDCDFYVPLGAEVSLIPVTCY